MRPETHRPRFIYIACPWTPKGGGMFKVADYLIQNQAQRQAPPRHAELRPLDTRGSGPAAWSAVVLAGALLRLAAGRLSGRLAGVHVNMAERLSLVRKSLLILACRLLGLPVVLHLHAAQLHHFYRALPAPLKALTRAVFRLPQCCVVLGEASRRFVTLELGVPAQRVRVLINGVPEPVARRRQPGAMQQVLFVGNLSERKGVSDLLAALAAPGFDAQHTRVSFAGGGDVQAYRRRARELGLQDWVRFEGWADQRRVAELMAQADVLVLPSYDEGLPLVILEALSHGVAVLCTPVGEIPSMLRDGEHALFTPAGDVPALAAQLQRLLHNPPLRERLERQGRALYEAEFSMRHFFDGVARIHRACFGVCASRPSPARTPSPAARPTLPADALPRKEAA